MDWGRCKNCGGYGYLPHRCVEFEVCCEGEDTWDTQYGVDYEDALERWAEQDDCQGDYTIIKAGECGDLHVLIRNAAHPEEVKRYHVIGETVPQYHAYAAEKV
jgi:hypothetical protein